MLIDCQARKSGRPGPPVGGAPGPSTHVQGELMAAVQVDEPRSLPGAEHAPLKPATLGAREAHQRWGKFLSWPRRLVPGPRNDETETFGFGSELRGAERKVLL